MKITEPGNTAAMPDRRQKKKDIKILGKVSEKDNVPKPTPLHKNLVKTSKKIAKEEAGLTNDPRIKDESSSSSNAVDFSESTPSESENSDTSLEHTDDDFDMGRMTPTKAKQQFRTHFDVMNERIEELNVIVGQNKVDFQNLFE